MAEVTLGVFTSSTDAEYAIQDLRDAGYDPKDISIVMRDAEEADTLAHDTGTNVAGGAVSGATTGGLIGGLAGLLIGVGAITIPGIGGFLVGGPLAAALGLTGAAASTVTGAATGAVAGGLLGALMSLGIPEEEARIYEDRINEGGILVAVPSAKENTEDARAILEENDADQVRVIRLHPEARLQRGHSFR